jgi:DNA-binding response OmpR family regulator
LNSNKDSDNNISNDNKSKIAATTTAEAATKGNNKHTYKILVVDDERDIASVIKKGLKSNGFEVDSYNDPTLALEEFRADVYDILVIDIKMPKMNGFELYKKIKEIDNKVKVCFLTAIEYYNDEFRMAFPKLTLKCFADKPISIDLLAKIIKQELEGP